MSARVGASRSARIGASVLALLVTVLLLGAAAATAATPRSFYGVTWDRAAATAPPADQTAQFARMGESGVGAVRAVFSWAHAQREREGAFDFSATDALVADATSAGVQLLPIVMYAPEWARSRKEAGASPPSSVSAYAAYVGALVQRYGRGGTFWAERTDLPARPIVAWQIWNEPHLRYQWDLGPRGGNWQRGYTALLRAAHRAVKQRDARAQVVLAGLTNMSWRELARLYAAGARRWFDVGAVHAYTGSVANVMKLVRLFRVVMKRHGDRRKPVWLTEVSWPAARGRLNPGVGFRSVITTDRGMAQRLADLYRVARRARARLRLGRVYWYSWATSYRGRAESFDYAGLGQYRDGVFTPKPALRAFVEAARD